MILTNNEIYTINNMLMEIFQKEDNSHYFSAKINFLIQKNKNLIYNAAVEIEKVRLEIISTYKDEVYNIPKEKIAEVNNELNELLKIEQDIPIKKISFEDLEGIDFTPAQMKALMFMIDDGEEDEK